MANIQSQLQKIITAIFGRDVRQSIYDGLRLMNEETESTTTKQKQLEGTFNSLIINAGNSNAENVAARTKADGTTFDTVGKRLDASDSQLDNTNAKVSKKVENDIIIYCSNPPAPLQPLKGDGTDESSTLQAIFDYCATNNKKLFIDSGTYVASVITNKKIVVEGAGPRNTILKCAKNNDYVMSFIGNPVSDAGHSDKHIEFINISNLTLDGNAKGGGLCLKYVARSAFKNIEIRNSFGFNGMFLLECFDSGFYDFSIGECGKTDRSKSGIYIQNGDTGNVDNSNLLRFYNFILQNNITDVVLDGTHTPSPNNNIAFLNTHIEYWPSSHNDVLSAVFIKGKNNNITFEGGTIVNYPKKYIEFDATSEGFYLFENIQQYGNDENMTVYDIKGTSNLRVIIQDNNFVSGATHHVMIQADLMKNIFLRDNVGASDADGSYRVNAGWISDVKLNTLADLDNLSFKNRKGATLLNVLTSGTVTSSDARRKPLANNATEIFDLGNGDNVNGINFVFIGCSNYLDTHVVAYTSGNDIHVINNGDSATCSKTNLDTDNKLNVYMESNGRLAIKNKLGADVKVGLYCIQPF